MRSASASFEMSARTKLWPFGGLSGRWSESRSLYLPASSRLRCVPTSPVAPVINMVFMLSSIAVRAPSPNSGPVLGVDGAFRRAPPHDLGGLRDGFHRLVLDRRQRQPRR